MKFIHLADAHLDSPFVGLSFLPSAEFDEIRTAANVSLKRICDLAITEKVDLVLIAGDTFDSPEPSPKSQLFFKKQIERLCSARIQVVMVFGNHDHMPLQDLFLNNQYFKILGAGEKVEKASFITRTGFKYDVVGFSYLNNHIEQDLIKTFPKKGNNYTFGLAHAGAKSGSDNVYAPFVLSDFYRLNYDYFALGHIHLRQILSKVPWVVYPGNIQGRHVNELGAKGCYLGSINEKSGLTQIEFKATAPITWIQQTVELTQGCSKNDLASLIVSNLDAASTSFYSLVIAGAEYLTEQQQELLKDSDFWQLISEQLRFNSQLVDVRFKTKRQIKIADRDKDDFAAAKRIVFDDQEFFRIISDWLKKDELAAELSRNPDFVASVRQLTQVKLAQKITENYDETNKNSN